MSIERAREYFRYESLKRFDSVYPACGSSNSAIMMTMEELAKYSGYEAWIDVCKPINEA